MASVIKATLSSLQTNHPSIKLSTPDSPDYEALRKTYIITPSHPCAIARPKTAEEVKTLVRACIDNGVEFNVRSGGHNCVGRTLLDNALTIDMRDISYVQVSEDRKSANIGGGVLAGTLLRVLGEHGLVTPCGTVSSVGYVGWSTLGGYGPFSTLYGPGVDQIISAKLVNSEGDIVTADDDLLKGIRGAGPIFGPIVELKIKVFELKELLVGTLIFDSSDMASIWASVTQGIQSLLPPDELQIQLFAMDFPGVGKVLAAIVTWASDSHDEGHKWIDKVASLGTCIINQTEAKIPTKYAEDNEKLVHYGVYGRSYTINLKEWTPKAVSILAKYTEQVPSGKAMISVHSLRSPKENKQSVFGAREPHHMLEIVSMTTEQSLEAEVSAWGQSLLKEIRECDTNNILNSAFISLLDYDDADIEKIYGEHFATLVELKKKYDPQNVFRNAAPKFSY